MTRSTFAPALLLCFCGLIVVGASGPALAQFSSGGENIQGFTVVGKGAVAAKPNLVEIDLEVTAASELTADAIVKYRDARKRLRDAFTALKLENVAVDERGLLVDQKGQNQNNYFFGGMSPSTRAKVEVQLTRKLVVKATDIRKLDEDAMLQLVARMLDVAQDAGAKIGGQSNFNPYYYRYNNNNSQGLVRFIVDDFDKLQEEAYEKAIADATTRAQRLARLSHVELGPIVAAREVLVPGDVHNPYNNYDSNANSDDEMPHKRLEASRFQEIPIRVELLVRFDIRPTAAAPTPAGGR